MDANTSLDLTGNLGSAVEVDTYANPVTIADHYDNTLLGRCDSFSNNFGQGCVDQAGPAYVEYNTIDNPQVGPVAQHVLTAIQTKPSHYGDPNTNHPLTRLTDKKAIDANRAVSCAGVVVTPGVTSCDEYPLASSYQGGNGAAPDDRSTAVVPKGANDSQGGLTQGYYDYYRILDADPFWVQAVLADGTKAW
ncbi:NucA/NucB deoxyribonuclease domain-containing protein [Amycolatopsis sp. NPDC058278]|uniref:NucA/NucB deoxyribonuclease domain-containing protein n=1 Tax=Amycolatopsis sp. NPDC058278 TaxID=3346417 RepID=UPI0036DBD01E